MLRWVVRLRGQGTANQRAVTVRHYVYSFRGDYRGNEKIDVHVFNTVTLIWRELTPETPGTGERHLEVPSWRRGHTAVLIGDTVYLWGGFPYCNVLYAFDVDAHRWFKPHVSGTVPEGRSYHSACVLGKVMYIHGGNTKTEWTNDIYKLDTTTMVWALINTRGTQPPAAWCHSATIIGTKMFVFGGWGRRQYRKTFRVFDTETNQWLNTPSTQLLPEGRGDHSDFTYNGELYIFGGLNVNSVKSTQSKFLNDVWKFSPETFSWKKVEPKGKGPPPTYSMCCCMMGDRIILFGGYKHTVVNGTYKPTSSDDLYVLDFSPSLKTLCKLAVIQYGLDQSELPHNIRWELVPMTSNSS